MKYPVKNLRSLLLVITAASLLWAAPDLPAESLLLDFGPTTISSDSLTNSPGQATGSIPLSDTTWNKVTIADITSGLLYGDGTSASGVSLILGVEATIGNNIIDFANKSINGSALTGSRAFLLGTDYSNSADTNAPAAKDGIFRSSATGTQNAAIGLRIDGLAVGDYLVYVVGRNTNNSADILPETFYATTGGLSNEFNFSSLTGTGLANSITANSPLPRNSTWIDGNQYGAFTLSVTAANSSLYIAAEGASASELRGFINMVQIVAIPEPATWGLAIGGFGLLILARRRSARGRSDGFKA